MYSELSGGTTKFPIQAGEMGETNKKTGKNCRADRIATGSLPKKCYNISEKTGVNRIFYFPSLQEGMLRVK